MSRKAYDRGTLAAIAAGGVLGASLRWLLTQGFSDTHPDGWFVYATNSPVSIRPSTTGPFEFVRSAQTISGAAGIPFDTLIVNVLGCLLLGALTFLLVGSASRYQRLLVGAATGLCASLTTFSTLAVEVAVLLRGKPVLAPELDNLDILSLAIQPAAPTALAYLGLSITGGALAFWVGRTLACRVVHTAGKRTIGTEQ
jgi:fluoride ion exporter CrcB/FEX